MEENARKCDEAEAKKKAEEAAKPEDPKKEE